MVKKTTQSGITMVELLVVLAIFSVISSILLFKYSDFSTNVSIRNLTQDVALTLRKAQTYATSVQSLPNGTSTIQFPSYGVSFSPDTTSSDYVPNNKRIVFFADIPSGSPATPNKKYDSASACGAPDIGNECIQRISVATGDKITEICRDVSGVKQCSTSGMMDITFKRPSPDAIICFRSGGTGSECAVESSSYAQIKFQSPKGLVRSVFIWNTGQISVE